MKPLTLHLGWLAIIAVAAQETTTDTLLLTSPFTVSTSFLTSPPPSTVAPPKITTCPTVTKTGTRCSTCIVPQCIMINTYTAPCSCPDPPETVTVDFPCESGCASIGCSTSSVVVVSSGGCDEPTSDTTCDSTTETASSSDATDSTVVTDSTATSSAGGVTGSTGEASSTLTSATASPVSTNAAGRLSPFRFW